MADSKKKAPVKRTKAKAAPKKSSRRSGKGKKGKGKNPRSFKRRFWMTCLKLAVVGIAALVIYGIYLDGQIRQRFDGEKWQLPAQVYSRGLELYPGQKLSVPQMLRELKLLNYRKVRTPMRPGEFSASSTRIELYRRPFTFPDGYEPGRRLLLSFDNDELSAIQDPNSGSQVGYARLDPVLLARITFGELQDRIMVRFKQVPPMLVKTLLAVEDRDFYQHGGISPEAIARAFLANLRAGHTVQGGAP